MTPGLGSECGVILIGVYLFCQYWCLFYFLLHVSPTSVRGWIPIPSPLMILDPIFFSFLDVSSTDVFVDVSMGTHSGEVG